MGGAGNNPAIRLLEYNRTDGTVTNIYQYYLDLRKANKEGTDTWELEYNFTDYYNKPNMSPSSMHSLAEELWADNDVFHKYYMANGVRYDPEEKWNQSMRIVHFCSMVHVSYPDYEQCVEERNIISGSPQRPRVAPLVITGLVFLACTYFYY